MSPGYQMNRGPSPADFHPSPSPIPVDFSPPLIAMVVIVATAFFIVTYFRLISRHFLPPILFLLRQWRHRWYLYRHRHRHHHHHHHHHQTSDIESPSQSQTPSIPPFDFTSNFHFLSPYGLDDEVIKTLPLTLYSRKSFHDCAVCLLEFEENEYIRTLPICSHAFHIDCVDIWLRSHANCPLCRSNIFRSRAGSRAGSRAESPFIPLMASRIRPSLDETMLQAYHLDRFDRQERMLSPAENNTLEESFRGSGRVAEEFRLKRSFSFGFERNLPTNRIVMEAALATPWRYTSGRSNKFWNKRPYPYQSSSPFSTGTKSRVFSFRYMKSPFFRRRISSRFFPMSERYVGGSRRCKSMTSPMFMRSSTTASMTVFSSSRMRCGDLEALLSPERLVRTRGR